MKHLFILSGLASTLLAAGCGEERACTLEAVTSVGVTVNDGEGEPLEGAEITYAVGDGEFSDCEEYGGGAYGCGIEEAGEFTIRGQHAGYSVTDEAVVTVGVTDDECHVIGESVTLTITE